MNEIVTRCRELPYFDEFETSTLNQLAKRGELLDLAGGRALFRQGEPSSSLYFLLSGRLVVVRSRTDADEVVGYVRAGEPVGEMSLLSKELHSASVFALRDSKILKIPYEEFDDLFDQKADFASALAMSIVSRSRHPTASFESASPRVFAVISSSPSIDLARICDRLARKIKKHDKKVLVLTEDDHPKSTYEFERLEREYDVLLLTTKVTDTDWYRFVLRHTDRFFVLARQDSKPPRPFPLTTTDAAAARKFRLVDLVMLHEGQDAKSTSEWAFALDANRIFQCNDEDDFNRLARAISGRTVALVLSGGGARAYAHIGSVRALRERGIPIDFTCGASMGSIIAACVAMGWEDDEIEERIRDAFVKSNPLGDHVFPVVALTRGRLVEERLKRHFGDKKIENLELPFFCVSSELTQGVMRVHRRGVLRDALRASISLPGILPPIVDGEDLLVDGAVVNNFPTDVMENLHRGVTIGVDVARAGTISVDAYRNPPNFFQWIRRHGIRSAPPIVALLMRSATARHESTHIQHPADMLVTPSVGGVELRDWKKFDVAVKSGYESTLEAIGANNQLGIYGIIQNN